MRALGSRSRGSGRVYLTGGATALLHGWREMTADIDIKLDPEPLGAFEAIAKLKNELDMNVELASPDLFIPPVPGWRQRSLFITREWDVEFYHFDPLSQALAKLSRGYERDVSDVHAMLAEGLFRRESLVEALESIESDLIRYPGLDAHRFRQRVMNFVGGGE
ncbi:MAG: DUF6036 family nucleotidyltransferase [Myxococcota bacterium]